jgi:thiamine-monophosphate kinase
MSEMRTELSQLGEFGLIDRINSKFSISQPTTLKGIGDDAALLMPAVILC